jgi:hypothetical protein
MQVVQIQPVPPAPAAQAPAAPVPDGGLVSPITGQAIITVPGIGTIPVPQSCAEI